MPTYEYECTKCYHLFERFQPISEPPLKICPKCGHKSLKRLIGAGSGIIFRGSGFYITDYCRPKHKTEAVGEKKSTKKDGQNNKKD